MFAPGDKVTWTHIGGSRRTMSMRLREGTVVESNDKLTTVKSKSGKFTVLHTCDLRGQGQKSTLTEFVEEVVAASKHPEEA